MGRHKPYSYFTSQQAIAESANANESSANKRAFAARLFPRAWAALNAIWSQWPAGVSDPAPSAQNRAICVWSAVRVVLSRRPICFVSFTSAAYWALVNAGGGTERYWLPESIVNGST